MIHLSCDSLLFVSLYVYFFIFYFSKFISIFLSPSLFLSLSPCVVHRCSRTRAAQTLAHMEVDLRTPATMILYLCEVPYQSSGSSVVTQSDGFVVHAQGAFWVHLLVRASVGRLYPTGRSHLLNSRALATWSWRSIGMHGRLIHDVAQRGRLGVLVIAAAVSGVVGCAIARIRYSVRPCEQIISVGRPGALSPRTSSNGLSLALHCDTACRREVGNEQPKDYNKLASAVLRAACWLLCCTVKVMRPSASEPSRCRSARLSCA